MLLQSNAPTMQTIQKRSSTNASGITLRPLPGTPMSATNWSTGFLMVKKPALMPMHEFMQRRVQLLSCLDGGYLCQTMEMLTVQEKNEQIFFAQPKVHCLQIQTRRCLQTCSSSLLSLSSVKQAIKRLAFLRRFPRTKSSQKKEDGSSSHCM